MGIWVFLHAWLTNDFFYMFGLLSLGEAIWVVMETFCLQRALKYERELCWPEGWSDKKCIMNMVLMTLAFFVGVVCLAFAIRGAVMYEKLPDKPGILEATSKKPLLK